MSEPKHLRTELVRADITVLIQRDTYLVDGEEYSLLTFDKSHPLTNELTREEKDRVLGELTEHFNSSYIINGILSALAGKSSRL